MKLESSRKFPAFHLVTAPISSDKHRRRRPHSSCLLWPFLQMRKKGKVNQIFLRHRFQPKATSCLRPIQDTLGKMPIHNKDRTRRRVDSIPVFFF